MTGDFERFYNAALKFLSYRPRSEQEIRNKLKEKRVSQELIEKIILKLKEKKFINDEEFARLFVENRLRFKPRSLHLIKLELKQKGINQEIINNLEFAIDSDLEQAKILVEKRMAEIPKQVRNDTGKDIRKTRRYLASKGFSWDMIKKSIDEALRKGV